MAKTDSITPEILRELLRYEPDTGKLYWRERALKFCGSEREQKIWNTKYAGKEALTALDSGYRCGTVLRVNLYAHRVAYCIATGAPIKAHIDHINMDRSDNRLANLREASHRENSRNRTARKGASGGGLKGVSLVKSTGRWHATITKDAKGYFLGSFDTAEAAHRAYAEAAPKYHGDFARTE